MKFYIITTTSDPKIIGTEYPQMEYLDSKVTDGLDKISEHKGKKVKAVEPIYNLRMPSKNKITDIISCSLGAGGDFIISRKMYQILSKLNCTSIQFFPITFEYKKDLYTNFYWVHFIYSLESFIDPEKSEYDDFFIKNLNSNKPADYTKFAELVQQHKKYNHFRLIKTVLQKKFPIQEDFFVLSFANQNKYISERLYKEIRSEKISGLDIKVAHDLFFS